MRRLLLGLLLFALGAGALLFLKLRFGIGFPCLFFVATGLYCPGCGTTRAAVAAFHGDIALSFRSNALLYVYLPVLAFLLGTELVCYLTAKPRPAWFRKAELPLTLGLGIIGVLFGILRNIPAFSFLAPL